MSIQPEEIVALRHQWNSLVDRFDLVEQDVAALNGFVVSVSGPLQTLFSGPTDYDWEERGEYEPPEVGTPLEIGQLYKHLGLESHLGSNYSHHLRSLQEQCSVSLEKVNASGSPNFDGWDETELRAARDRYRRRINDLNNRLREANTDVKQIVKPKAALPSSVRSLLLDFFAGSDATLPWRYEEVVFSHRYEDREQLLPICSAQWLAPFTGLDMASQLNDALTRLMATTAPLPGEPETLDYRGSHRTNAFNFFAEQGSTNADGFNRL